MTDFTIAMLLLLVLFTINFAIVLWTCKKINSIEVDLHEDDEIRPEVNDVKIEK